MKKLSELKFEWLHREVDKLLDKGMSKADISRKLGVLPQYLNNILMGKRGVTDNFVDLFRNTFSINHIDLYNSPVCTDEGNSGEEILRQILTEQRNTIMSLSRENGQLQERLASLTGNDFTK